MLKICLVFCKFEPQYTYKRYAYKKKHVSYLDFWKTFSIKAYNPDCILLQKYSTALVHFWKHLIDM